MFVCLTVCLCNCLFVCLALVFVGWFHCMCMFVCSIALFGCSIACLFVPLSIYLFTSLCLCLFIPSRMRGENLLHLCTCDIYLFMEKSAVC